MAIVKAAWAANYLRWAGVFGVTAGIHAVAFCLYVEGGGKGNGPATPEGHVTLNLTQADAPCAPALTPFRTPERPAVSRTEPVQIERPKRSDEQFADLPLTTPSARPALPHCAIAQALMPTIRATAVSTCDRRAVPGHAPNELDRPISLGDGQMPPRIVSGSERPADSASSSLCGSRNAASSDRRSPGAASTDEGTDADFALGGKPMYPVTCRRGECTGHAPCEGVSRWRITVPSPDSSPTRIEQLQSAGCARLDASVERFLSEARIPRAGVFLLRFRFKLDGR